MNNPSIPLIHQPQMSDYLTVFEEGHKPCECSEEVGLRLAEATAKQVMCRSCRARQLLNRVAAFVKMTAEDLG